MLREASMCCLLQERSKPVQPPKKPEAAPFFLPTVAGLSRVPVFDATAVPQSTAGEADGKLPGWGNGKEGKLLFTASMS